MDDPTVGGQEQVQEPTGVVDAPSGNGGSASEAPASTPAGTQLCSLPIGEPACRKYGRTS